MTYNMDTWVQQEAQLSRGPCTEWGCVYRSIELIRRWVDWIRKSGDDACIVTLQGVIPPALELLSQWARKNRLCIVSSVEDGQTSVIITRYQRAVIVYTETAHGDPYGAVTPRLQMLVEYSAFFILNVHLPCRPWSDNIRGAYLTHFSV